MEIGECPILYPTWKEFKHFHSFVEKVEKAYNQQYGMVKVVPPPQWKSKFSDYPYKLDKVIVRGPIEQNIFGKGGIYQCLHIQKKSMSLKQYKQKMSIFDRITSGLKTQQIESMFWKSIAYSPPLYGADLMNTLMDERCGQWNLNKLDSILKYSINNDIRGVTSSYCYVGSWKTLFCWHKEDLDLSAINFLHEGKSKFWYSIPRNQGHILQKEFIKYFPEHFSKCSQHLRHKTSLINPYLLKKRYPQLKMSKVQHRPGEFILVLGGSYHCGFNFGFNIAEAINYATIAWLNRLPHIKSCTCQKQSVRVDNLAILNNLQSTPYSKTHQFEELKRYVEETILKQEQSQRKKQEQIGVKSQYSKKIKKIKKVPRKMKVNGQQYQIDNWVLCDKCHVWRRVKGQYESNKFQCKQIGKHCNQKQKYDKDMIIL